jgi:drug/metabolite transporter (DMT)-like permease
MPLAAFWGGLSPTVRGCLLATAGTALFALMNLIVKLIGTRLPAVELTFFRALFGWMALWPLLLPLGRRGLRTARPGAHAMRGGLGAVALVLTMYGITHLPMAEAVSYQFSRGLLMVPLALLLLGEPFRLSRVAATVAGFAGVLVIMRPEAGLELGAVAALAAALLSAMVAVVIRRMMTAEPAYTVMFYFGLCTTIGAGIPLPFFWVMPTSGEFALMAALGVVGGVGQTAQFLALRHAEASVVVPFDYLMLPFAASLAFLFLGEVPTMHTLAGAAIIIAANLFLAWRARSR